MSLLQTALALGLALYFAATPRAMAPRPGKNLQMSVVIPEVGAQPRTSAASLEAASLVDKAVREEIKSLKGKMKLLEEEVKICKSRSSALEAQVRKFMSGPPASEAKVEELWSARSRALNCRKVPVLAIAGGCRLDANCLSRLRFVTINETATYTLTLGGGGGGFGFDPRYGWVPGGRGAVVRMTGVISVGSFVGVVVGCGGRKHENSDMYSGHGGNATIVMHRSAGLVLAMAGGGGGADESAPGLHGRATEEASDAWNFACELPPDIPRFMRQSGFPGPHGGLGLHQVRDRVLVGPAGIAVGTGGRTYGKLGGGGGGGYRGGGGRKYLPGGGGSSFCHSSFASGRCEFEEGGNYDLSGYFVLEKHVCS